MRILYFVDLANEDIIFSINFYERFIAVRLLNNNLYKNDRCNFIVIDVL